MDTATQLAMGRNQSIPRDSIACILSIATCNLIACFDPIEKAGPLLAARPRFETAHSDLGHLPRRAAHLASSSPFFAFHLSSKLGLLAAPFFKMDAAGPQVNESTTDVVANELFGTYYKPIYNIKIAFEDCPPSSASRRSIDDSRPPKVWFSIQVKLARTRDDGDTDDISSELKNRIFKRLAPAFSIESVALYSLAYGTFVEVRCSSRGAADCLARDVIPWTEKLQDQYGGTSCTITVRVIPRAIRMANVVAVDFVPVARPGKSLASSGLSDDDFIEAVRYLGRWFSAWRTYEDRILGLWREMSWLSSETGYTEQALDSARAAVVMPGFPFVSRPLSLFLHEDYVSGKRGIRSVPISSLFHRSFVSATSDRRHHIRFILARSFLTLKRIPQALTSRAFLRCTSFFLHSSSWCRSS